MQEPSWSCQTLESRTQVKRRGQRFWSYFLVFTERAGKMADHTDRELSFSQRKCFCADVRSRGIVKCRKTEVWTEFINKIKDPTTLLDDVLSIRDHASSTKLEECTCSIAYVGRMTPRCQCDRASSPVAPWRPQRRLLHLVLLLLRPGQLQLWIYIAYLRSHFYSQEVNHHCVNKRIFGIYTLSIYNWCHLQIHASFSNWSLKTET